MVDVAAVVVVVAAVAVVAAVVGADAVVAAVVVVGAAVGRAPSAADPAGQSGDAVIVAVART